MKSTIATYGLSTNTAATLRRDALELLAMCQEVDQLLTGTLSEQTQELAKHVEKLNAMADDIIEKHICG